ncbi:EamA family transporter [Massilia sp. Mn16-1_5]|uniref:EamA family transporter n=1 Tax=Massilia sp. Mn16-1_5 TaxID=2079199 RepID=UPI00109E5A33|nr:EamA family transporter [Massilia sp. Mn16-1_5]THC46568.1 EamA family transporter [Massilia sp. Mn16-1_5]
MSDSGALEGRDYAAALCVVLVWGTNFVAMKLGLREVTPFQLGAGRYLFALLPLLLFVRPPKLAARWVVLYGLFQGVGQFGLLFLALRAGMSASLAPVMLQMQVFFTALFAAAILKEHIERRLQAAMGIAALGLACLCVDALGRNSTVTLMGFVLSVASAAMWAASNIVVRVAQRSTPRFEVLPFMVWSSMVPILPFAALSLAFDPPSTNWNPQAVSLTAWSSMAYLGWFATILGYAMWTGLLKRHPANRVAPFSLAVPPVGIAAGMLFLDEIVTPWQWAGIVLVVASLALVMLRPRVRATAPV